MGMVWIASYPKSGNTWVRFLLVNYLFGPVPESKFVEQVAPYVEMIGQVHLADGARLLSKTHFPFVDHPFAGATERSIYIARHPKDVLLSNLDYMRMLGGAAATFTDAEYIKSFIDAGSDPRWKSFGFGTLQEHLVSWLERHPKPLLTVRYEDLKADTAGELTRILRFLGESPDPARVAAAVARSDFRQMRSMEIREKSAGRFTEVFATSAPTRRGETPRYFMSEGRTTRSLAQINPALDEEFDQRFGAVLDRMGYNQARAAAG